MSLINQFSSVQSFIMLAKLYLSFKGSSISESANYFSINSVIAFVFRRLIKDVCVQEDISWQ